MTDEMRCLGPTLAILSMASCVTIAGSVATPTALEHQLLGVYEALDEDLVYASSVRGENTPALDQEASLRSRALHARALQMFHEDELIELKDAQCVAETNKATIVARPCPATREGEQSLKTLIQRVVRDENLARMEILQWAGHVLARQRGRDAPDAEEVSQMQVTYSRLLRDVAREGHLFETSAGEFVGVKK